MTRCPARKVVFVIGHPRHCCPVVASTSTASVSASRQPLLLPSMWHLFPWLLPLSVSPSPDSCCFCRQCGPSFRGCCRLPYAMVMTCCSAKELFSQHSHDCRCRYSSIILVAVVDNDPMPGPHRSLCCWSLPSLLSRCFLHIHCQCLCLRTAAASAVSVASFSAAAATVDVSAPRQLLFPP
jgi:hypothetical protein